MNDRLATRQRYETLVGSRPRDAKLWHEYAEWLDAQGDAPAALAAYRTVIDLAPASSGVALNAALLANRTGMQETAQPLLERALRASPQSADLWQMSGLVNRALDNHRRAVADFVNAARLSPRDARIAHGHARVALEAGLPALALFDRAHSLAPADAEILLGRTAAQFAEGRIDQAMADLDIMLENNPAWVAGHDLLARLRWMQGDTDGFTRSIETALAKLPTAVALWRALIALLKYAGAFDRALSVISRARAAAGDDVVFDLQEVILYDDIGETDRAAILFERMGSIDALPLKIAHIRHFLRTGKIDAAARLGETLMGRTDDDGVWPYLAIAWRLLGDPRYDWLEGDPRLVGVIDLSAHLPSLDDLAILLRGLHLANGQPIDQSVRSGTQTDGPLFSRIEPEIRDLRKAVVHGVRAHLDALPPRDVSHPTLRHRRDIIRFAGSWSVRLGGNGHHSAHIHSEGWFSSALYVALPSEQDRGDPQAGWFTLGQPQTELGLDLPPVRLIEPKPGTLVLFPSTMWHGTVPFQRGERLTVAFDVARPPP